MAAHRKHYTLPVINRGHPVEVHVKLTGTLSKQERAQALDQLADLLINGMQAYDYHYLIGRLRDKGNIHYALQQADEAKEYLKFAD